ncbi:unnamed protein product [Ilex paraguariensis]|uniref:Uncharacterized protein n=1 Tax=Ilex paraguariensis TaxID=185542 RepID=A0ABC8S0Q3_9AQUA
MLPDSNGDANRRFELHESFFHSRRHENYACTCQKVLSALARSVSIVPHVSLVSFANSPLRRKYRKSMYFDCSITECINMLQNLLIKILFMKPNIFKIFYQMTS